MAPERDLIACLEKNHKLMSEKEKLESDIAILKQEIKDKQTKLRDVDNSIARNRELLSVRCSSTGPDSLRAESIATPATSRTSGSTNKAPPSSTVTRRGRGRPAGTGARDAADLQDDCKSQQTAKNSTRLTMITDEDTSVVRFEEGWAEISCQVCGANAGRLSGAYFRGISGLHKHMYKSHPNNHISEADVVAVCKRRYLDDAEVRALQRGTSGIEKRFGTRAEGGTMVGRDSSEEGAAVPDDDSDVVEIEPPVVKKEVHDEDDVSIDTAPRSSPPIPEQAKSPRLPQAENYQDEDLARSGSPSPLEKFKSGLILPTVSKSGPDSIPDVLQCKRKRSPEKDEFDPFALSKEASKVRRTSNRAQSRALPAGDETGYAISAAKTEDKVIFVERSDDGEV